MINKIRLDNLLVNKNFFQSRERAKAEIMIGNIIVEKKKIFKPGTLVKEDSQIILCNQKKSYVSRGALKLKEIIKIFKINIKNKRCMDIGASTGGFTEILILNKASIVYSVDVGYNQLSWKLRNNTKVISLEKINCRYLTLKQVGNIFFDLIVIDVSFISLTKILESACNCLKNRGTIIALIKPQFEAAKGKVNKKGILYNKEEHENILKIIIEFSINLGLFIENIVHSPIKGKKGNIEYFFYFKKNNLKKANKKLIIKKIITKAFNELN